MKKTFTFFTFFILVLFYAQNKVDVAANWDKGEVFNVNFISEITDVKNKQLQTTSSSFVSKFSVDEISDAQIKITWVYTRALLDSKESNLENIIVSKIINQPLKITLSEFGKFENLDNLTEIRTSVSKIIDNELAKIAVKSEKILLNVAKNLIATDQGLEILITKNIKAYLFSFGYRYIENKENTHNLEIPNPFGGANFPATETVKMSALDENLKTCIVKTSKISDGDALKNAIINVMIQTNQKNAGEIENQLKDLQLEFSESSEHLIDYDKGIVNSGFYKRIMNFGVQDRIQLLKFSLQK
jgi:hypothetical protein